MNTLKIRDRILGALFLVVITVFCVLNAPLFCRTVADTLQLDTDLKQDIIEDEYARNLTAHNAFVDFNGLVARMTGKRVLNDRMLLYNGTLVSVYQTQDLTYVSNVVDAVTQLSDYLKNRELPFLYIQAPYKSDEDPSLVPLPVESNQLQRGQLILDRLQANGVETLSILQALKDQSINIYDAYYRTDHHWKPETALWACGLAQKALSERYGLRTTPEDDDLSNWKIDNYPNAFLGSDGKRVGVFFAGVEDFHVLSPISEPTIQYACPYTKIYQYGAFRDTLYDDTQIGEVHDSDTYEGYLQPGSALQYIVNEDNPDGLKVLIVGDSFSKTFTAFLMESCSLCVRLDMRYYRDSTLYALLENNEFDCVIAMFNSTYVNVGAVPIVPELNQTRELTAIPHIVLAEDTVQTVASALTGEGSYRLLIHTSDADIASTPWFTAILRSADHPDQVVQEKLFVANCKVAQVWEFSISQAVSDPLELVLQSENGDQIVLDNVAFSQLVSNLK